MGTPKESLTLAGTTFLDRVVTAASAAFDEVVVVSRNGAARRVRTIIEPPHAETAPLFGIQAALQDASAHHEGKAWVLAVDYPAITSDLLSLLRKRFESVDAELLVPMADGKPHMLCAGYSTALIPRISQRLQRRQFVLRELLEESTAVVVDDRETDHVALRNVNTPADHHALEVEYGQADASR